MTRRRNRREMSKPSAPPHYIDTTPTTCQPLLHLNQPPNNPLIKLSPQNLQKTLLLQTNPRSNPRRLLITHSDLILKPLIRPPSNQPYPSQSSISQSKYRLAFNKSSRREPFRPARHTYFTTFPERKSK